jgi:alkylation response protein AidB-like acyl-CoA dehydrogenase
MQVAEAVSWDGLTARQREIRASARAFTASHVTPVAAQHDAEANYPHEMVRAARRAGLSNTAIPESYGGPGFSAVEEVILAGEVGYGCVSMWTVLAIANLATIPILIGGSDEQRRRRFGEILAGAIPAFALTEPAGGSDVASLQTSARRKGALRHLRAKRYATELAMRASTEAVQIFGAAGIMRDNIVEKYFATRRFSISTREQTKFKRNIIARELIKSKECRTRRREPKPRHDTFSMNPIKTNSP